MARTERAMLGINWTPEKKRAFEELARQHGQTPTDFGREILEAVLKALLPLEKLHQIGLVKVWDSNPREAGILDYIVRKAKENSAAAMPMAGVLKRHRREVRGGPYERQATSKKA